MSQQWAVTSSCFTQLLHNTRTPTRISVVPHNFYISGFTLFSLCLVCLCLHQSDVCSSKQWGYPRATYIYCYDYTIVDWLLSFIYQSNHDEILKHLDWEKSVLDFFLMHHLLVAQCSSVVEMRPQWWCSWASTSSALWEALWPPRFVSFQTSLQGRWRWWRFAQCCSTYDSLRRSWKIASEALNGDRKVTVFTNSSLWTAWNMQAGTLLSRWWHIAYIFLNESSGNQKKRNWITLILSLKGWDASVVTQSSASFVVSEAECAQMFEKGVRDADSLHLGGASILPHKLHRIQVKLFCSVKLVWVQWQPPSHSENAVRIYWGQWT